MHVSLLFASQQRYGQDGEIIQNVALRSAGALMLCIRVGDVDYPQTTCAEAAAETDP